MRQTIEVSIDNHVGIFFRNITRHIKNFSLALAYDVPQPSLNLRTNYAAAASSLAYIPPVGCHQPQRRTATGALRAPELLRSYKKSLK